MSRQPRLLAPGAFHPVAKSSASLLAAAAALKKLIQQSWPTGVKEQALLRWFGESEERIALFPLGLPNQYGQVRVDFAVIAGMNADVADALSQKRLAHWREHVGFGNNLHISTFDALPIHAETLLRGMAELATRP